MSFSLLNVSSAINKPEEFSLNDIEVVVDSEGENWLKRVHVGKYLGLAKILMSVEGLDKRERHEFGSICVSYCAGTKDQQNNTDIFILRKGVKYVISRSRKSTYNLRILAKALGINIHENKWLFKELETILRVLTALKGEKMCTQYNVDGCRIDLYLPEHKLPLKCDEFGHRERDIEHEMRCQKHINEKLGCKFIRYNPDAEDFNLFRVINRNAFDCKLG